ncbi:helix-turn-helix domain-containing protein [Paenibacillus sp. YN15]|uniref:helix-turn-helix domain-containing protein n=1 Tax=Paenibacillus sp. YN15 TaxID=1742774 RepID=UPI000DCB8987|nr:helix-turn-helix domain-containing protein [Paenibacillus sp. YN15]RAV00205.1 hypothetical protein DQG13_14725 [Paenibacillus sp. YN15]
MFRVQQAARKLFAHYPGGGKIKKNLLISLIILSTIPVVIMALVSSYLGNNVISRQVNQMHLVFLSQVEKDMNSQFKKFDELMLQYTYNNSALLRYTKEELDHTNYTAVNDLGNILSNLKSGMEHVAEIDFYSKPFGKVVTSGGPVLSVEDFHDSVALDITNENLHYGKWVGTRTNVNSRLGKPVITYVRPLNIYDSGQSAGYFILYLDAASLSNKLIKHDEFNDPSIYYVVNSAGSVMLHSDPSFLGANIHSGSFMSELSHAKGTSYYSFTTNLDGKRTSISTVYSGNHEWYYVSVIPVGLITKETDQLRNMLLGICLLSILVMIAISFKTSSIVYFPMQKLLQHIGKYKPLPQNKDEANHILAYIDQYRNAAENYSLLSLLSGNVKGEDVHIENFGPNRIVIHLIELDQLFLQSNYSMKDQFLFYYALENIANEILGANGPSKTLMIQPGLFIVLSQPRNEVLPLYRSYADTLLNAIRTYLKINCVISISYADSGIHDLHEAYMQARHALRLSFTLGANQVIISDELDPSISDEASILTDMETQIIHSLQLFKYEEARQHFARLVQIIKEDFSLTSDVLMSYFSQLLGAMIHTVKKHNSNLSLHLSTKEVPIELTKLRNLAEIEAFIQKRFFDGIRSQPQATAGKEMNEQKLVEQVMEHIHHHYFQDISLQHCAELVGMSASQLSRSFKKVVGANFVDYVIQYRIKIAKDLLADPANSIQDIADKLRYTSVNSFIRVFKQVTGHTPGNYRKEFLSGKESPD